MSPTIIQNGREIPIAGWQAVAIVCVDNWMAVGREYRDTEICGCLHETYEQAVRCAQDRAEAERRERIAAGPYVHGSQYGTAGTWSQFRVEPVRELPELEECLVASDQCSV